MEKYFLIASDFFSDFELIKAKSQEEVENYIKANLSGSETKTEADIQVVCSCDDMLLEDVKNKYPELVVLFLSDYYFEE